MVKDSAAGCSISLKFSADFEHVTLHVLQKLKVKRSKVKVTAWCNDDEYLLNKKM